jgi:hypothetical protein
MYDMPIYNVSAALVFARLPWGLVPKRHMPKMAM